MFLSIIVPAYNVESYIGDCLESILNNTDKDFEVIVIDDGSEDKTLDICNRYTSEHVRVYTKPNGGLSSARNYGISHSKGDFIAFVDSDDVISKSYVARLKGMVRFGDIIQFRFARFKDGNAPKYRVLNKLPRTVSLSEACSDGFQVCNKIYKRDLFSQVNVFKEGVLYEDIIFTCQRLLGITHVFTISDRLYGYRDNPNSITNTNRSGDYLKSILFSLNLARKDRSITSVILAMSILYLIKNKKEISKDRLIEYLSFSKEIKFSQSFILRPKLLIGYAVHKLCQLL